MENYKERLENARALLDGGDHTECINVVLAVIKEEIAAAKEEKRAIDGQIILETSEVGMDGIAATIKFNLFREGSEEKVLELCKSMVCSCCSTVGNSCAPEEIIEFMNSSFTKLAEVFGDAFIKAYDMNIETGELKTEFIPLKYLYQFMLIKSETMKAMNETSGWKKVMMAQRKLFDQTSFIDIDGFHNKTIEASYALYKKYRNSTDTSQRWRGVSAALIHAEYEMGELDESDSRYLDFANLLASIYYTILNECTEILAFDDSADEKRKKFDNHVKKIREKHPSFIFDFEREQVEDKRETVEYLREHISKTEKQLAEEPPVHKKKYITKMIIAAIVLYVIYKFVQMTLIRYGGIFPYVSYILALIFVGIYVIISKKIIKKFPLADKKIVEEKKAALEKSKKSLSDAEEFIRRVEGN